MTQPFAVILGRAATVWAELEELRSIREPDIVIAVNVAGRDYPGIIHHWVSFHAELFQVWLKDRRKAGYPEPGKLWTGERQGAKLGKGLTIPLNWVEMNGGSSGLLAVHVGLKVVPKMVLCGIPMENSPRFDDERNWSEAMKYRSVWEDEYPTLHDRVKSMSGWTRQLLGYPDRAWLGG